MMIKCYNFKEDGRSRPLAISIYRNREVQTVKIKKLLYQIKPPCKKCPYKLGLVQTLRNLCSWCKANGYEAYERFKGYKKRKG